MYSEYDVVIARRLLEDVPKGSNGTILIVYEQGNNYEVEFVDEDGNTIKVLTVNEIDIEKV